MVNKMFVYDSENTVSLNVMWFWQRIVNMWKQNAS